MSVLDSLRYELKTLGSGQVPLLSDILTNIAEGAKKNTLTPVIATPDRNQNPSPDTQLVGLQHMFLKNY